MNQRADHPTLPPPRLSTPDPPANFMNRSPLVLLVTHSGDYFTVERVAEALARRGARPFRLDTDLFPEAVRLSARLGAAGASHLFGGDGGAALSAGEVRAVWARKVWAHRLSENLDERFRA